jgi:hypothetical protein
MLTLTPRVLGTFYCVLFLQVMCRMKKLLGGVNWAFSSSPSNRGSSSHSSDSRSQSSARSSSFMPSPHETAGPSHYPVHDDVPEAMNSDAISIHTTEEMEKYESLHHWEFAHTRAYDVNLLERIGLEEVLPTILQTIGWGKLSYPVFIPKPSTHHMHDLGSIVPHIRPKVLIDNQMSWI